MEYFYKPRPGVLGDCIPYYSEADGRYHVFYLRDYRDRDSYPIGAGWDHLSTTDFVRFEDHGEALALGRADRQEYTTGTGCVYTDAAGTHHLFYTGINPHFRDDTHYEQAVMHATSDDLLTWTRVPGEVWYPDVTVFGRHDWRDPFVYRHPETGRYCMLLAARLKDGPVSRRGCTVRLTSDDLTHWADPELFYAPARFHGHECPDWFRIGDWYYLVFSEYGVRTTTRYVMSRSPDGPWASPDDDQFDNRAFYAAKSASDGSRRFLFGWNPTKVGQADHGDWHWGGNLTVHEIVQHPDGALVSRLPAEAADAFHAATPVAFERCEPGWNLDSVAARIETPFAYSAATSGPMPDTYLLRGEITFALLAGSVGILVGMDAAGDSGYFLRFDPVGQRLEFGKVGGYRSWYVDRMPELDRTLAIRAGTPLQFSIVVDKTAVVAYVDDRVALSARMYPEPFGRCGLFADGASITVDRFESLTLRDAPALSPTGSA